LRVCGSRGAHHKVLDSGDDGGQGLLSRSGARLDRIRRDHEDATVGSDEVPPKVLHVRSVAFNHIDAKAQSVSSSSPPPSPSSPLHVVVNYRERKGTEKGKRERERAVQGRSTRVRWQRGSCRSSSSPQQLARVGSC
jgi:hypothetical protein